MMLALFVLASVKDGLSVRTENAATEASFTLKVSDPEKVADMLAQEADRAGGYFSERTDESIVLRVPNDKVGAILGLAETQGLVMDRDFQKTDLAEALSDARAQVRAREETLGRYLSVLKGAGPTQVVMVEREIVSQIQQIERFKGRIRAMEHRLRLAVVRISFTFRERRAPVNNGDSSFAWLNHINLSDLLEDFAHD
jgi:Domain of unknown function (DUF4349)